MRKMQGNDGVQQVCRPGKYPASVNEKDIVVAGIFVREPGFAIIRSAAFKNKCSSHFRKARIPDKYP
jgi:hypothetical protein